MATEKDVEFRLHADVSGFVAQMRKVAESFAAVQLSFGESLLPPLRSVAAELAEWFRVQASRDTRQVPCPGDGLNPDMHEFWITRGYACPGCGAAL